MAKWQSLLTALDALSLKERMLLFLAISLTLVFVANRTALQPYELELQVLGSQLKKKRTEIAELETRAQQAVSANTADPDTADRAKLRELRDELAKSREALAGGAVVLLPPEKVLEMLRTLLAESDGLTLKKLEGAGSRPLLFDNELLSAKDNAPASTAAPAKPVAYVHGVRLELEGSYLAIVNYLQAIEKLSWTLYWEAAELRVEKYPLLSFAVVINTVSASESWIGT